MRRAAHVVVRVDAVVHRRAVGEERQRARGDVGAAIRRSARGEPGGEVVRAVGKILDARALDRRPERERTAVADRAAELQGCEDVVLPFHVVLSGRGARRDVGRDLVGLQAVRQREVRERALAVRQRDADELVRAAARVVRRVRRRRVERAAVAPGARCDEQRAAAPYRREISERGLVARERAAGRVERDARRSRRARSPPRRTPTTTGLPTPSRSTRSTRTRARRTPTGTASRTATSTSRRWT